MKNRVIKVLLTMAMVVGLMPGMPAYADEDPAYAQYKNTTTVIKFDEKDWYLINYDTSTVTLLAKECVALSKYNQNSNDHNGYIYKGSTVEDTVNTYYTNSISADAKTAVSDGRMFLLTTEQASATTTDVRKSPAYPGNYSNRWWLCSLGSAGFNVAYVSGADGTVSENGSNVTCEFGVRPALELDLSKVTFDSTSKTFSLKPSHTHSFTYSASGATITATCTAADCDLPLVDGKHVATLIIAAPEHEIYGDGKDAAAQITDANSIQGEAKVQYQKSNGETYGEATETAPTDAGDYKASITLGSGDNTATASVEYTIAKADPVVEIASATAKYGQTLEQVILTVKLGNTPGQLTWVEAETTDVGNIGDHTFHLNFTPDDTVNYKSLSNVPVTVTVGKADNPATVTPTASVKKGGVELDLANSVTRNGATGTVSYKFLDEEDTKGCTLIGSKLISGDATGDVKVLVFVGEDDIYKALEAKLITVTITEKDPQTITAQDVTVTYGDTDKSVSATTSGDGQISYAVTTGSENYIGVDSTTGALTIKSVPENGTASVTITASETVNYAQATKDVTVTINKADPVATAPAASATYGQTLADVALANPEGNTPGTWAFTDAGTTSVGNAGQNTFTANFTPTDSVNYNSVSSVNITVSVAKADPSYTAPIAVTGLEYDKNEHNLITAGSTSDGTMYYCIGQNASQPTAFGTDIPKAADAKTYYVFYQIKGDANHNDTDPLGPVEATIAKADPSYTAPSANTLTYNKNPQALITAGSTEDGTMKYSTDGTNYSAAIPAGTDAGPYTVYYKVEGDKNHNNTDPQNFTVTIAQADPSKLLPDGYNTVAEPEDYLGSVKLPEGWTWVNGEQYVSSQEGTYTFPAKYTADTKNYKQDPVDITVVVSKAYYDYVSGSSSGVWTKGSAGTLSFTFKRSQKDELTYGCFVKASYDGSNEMTENTDFSKASGSLIISLNDSLLNSLSIGVHTLNITFEDGSAVTTFKVVEKSTGGDSSSTDYNPPKTGIE